MTTLDCDQPLYTSPLTNTAPSEAKQLGKPIDQEVRYARHSGE